MSSGEVADDGSQPSRRSTVGADRPLTQLEEDALGYRTFAESVAAGLDEGLGPDGLVIALHGKWGSGKTSAVNMAIDALSRLQADRDEAEKAIVVRFNPWWFSEQKDLVRAFFTEVSAAIGKKLSSDIRDGFRKIAKRVSGASDLVAGILSFTPAAFAAKPIADGIKAAGDSVSEEESLDTVRTQLAEALEREGRTIIVIIDDVDRLPADEARQIFRLVKSVADLPYVTYLLVFDREIATRGLESSADPEGPDWLEKIIQASFDLPPVASVDLRQLLFARLNHIVGDYTVDDHIRWGNILYGAVMPWVRSPRDVGRLANAIAMTWPTLKHEVDFPDLMAIETLRLFEPELYEFLRTQADQITGYEHERSDRARLEAYGEEILSHVTPEKRERVKKALCYLFPRLDAVFNNTWHGRDWREAEQKKRVQSKRRFPIYFNLGVDDGNLPQAEMERVIATLKDPQAFRESVQSYVAEPRRSGGTRASVLLDVLSLQAHSGFGLPDSDAATALLGAADLFLNPADGYRTPEGLPRSWAVAWLINPVLERLEAKTLEAAIADALEGPSLYTAAFHLKALRKEHGLGTDDEAKPKEERQLSRAAVKRLEKLYCQRIEKDAKSRALLDAYEPAAHLYSWSDYAGSEPVRSWIADNLEEDSFALWLMDSVTAQGVAHAFGDMVGMVTHNVHRPSVETLVDVARLEAIAETLVRDEKDPKGIADRFLKGLKATF